MKNFNNEIRKKIVLDIEDIMVKNYVSIKDAILIYNANLYNIFINDTVETETIKSMYYGVVFLDGYKYYSYRQKLGINKPIEVDYLAKINNIDSYYEYLLQLKKDPGLFCELLEATYYYQESNGMTKRLMIKSLSPEQNKRLIEIFPLHEEDLKSVTEEYTFEKLIKNIKSQDKYYKEVMTIKFDEGIALQTAGFIKQLYNIDKNNAKKLLLEIALKDYTISKYLIDKIKENKTLKEHIDKYESLTIDQIINLMILNEDFLINAIYQLIDLYINKSYLDTPLKDIPEEENETTKKLKNITNHMI